MREVRYKSSTVYGKSYEFTRLGALLTSTAPLVSSSFGYKINGRSVTNITRNTDEVTLSLFSNNPEEFERCRELIEADTYNGKAGILECDGWQASVYGVEFDVDDIHSNLHMEFNIKFVLVDGCWKKPTLISFEPAQEETSNALDFPYDYPHDLGRYKKQSIIEQPSRYPCKLTLTIWGTAINPRINIAGNSYAFDVVVPQGAKLVCDGSTTTKTIKLYSPDGIVSDVIDKGRRDSGLGGGTYCFEPVPSGTHTVQYDGTYGIDIELWEERGGLPWM